MNQNQLKDYLAKLNSEQRYIVIQNWKRDERTGMFRAKPKHEVTVLTLELDIKAGTKDYSYNNAHQQDKARRLKLKEKHDAD